MNPRSWGEIKKFLENLIGNTADTGGTSAAGTVMAKLNALLKNWTSTRASYIDRLADSTYGLSAIKTAVDNVLSKIGENGNVAQVTAQTKEFTETISGNAPLICSGSGSSYPNMNDTIITINGSGRIVFCNNNSLNQVQVYIMIDGGTEFRVVLQAYSQSPPFFFEKSVRMRSNSVMTTQYYYQYIVQT